VPPIKTLIGTGGDRSSSSRFAAIRSALDVANTAAIATAAVSTSVADVFSDYGREYQKVARGAAAFPNQFAQ
jgi:PE family